MEFSNANNFQVTDITGDLFPSANISSKLSPTCANDVVDEFGNKVKFILDGGQCKIGLESTIIDLTGKPKILRPGSITAEKIQKILKNMMVL